MFKSYSYGGCCTEPCSQCYFYSDIEEENNLARRSYEIERSDIADVFSLFFDIAYGSSVYTEIVLQTKYRVLKSSTGLLIREEKINEEKHKGLLNGLKAWFGIAIVSF